MSKLFILGSGFSKAVSSHMPTIRELAQHIETRLNQLPGDHRVYRRLLADPEGLLTYLFQAMPWKSPEETHVDRAAFIVLSRQIAEYLKECEAKAFGQAPPQWAVDFVQYLHWESVNPNRGSIVVATLNYDTLLERLSRGLKAEVGGDNADKDIGTESLYRMPLNHLAQRTTGLWNERLRHSYRLLKRT